ncbi:MAG: hypothetical protein H7Y11_09345, partial [Armatimonadetes bacterium]|nr:hypothetical protein [Anaerolineae bacterium]
ANVDFTVLRYLGEDTVPTNTPTHTPTDTLPPTQTLTPTQTFTPSPTITPGGPTLTPSQTPSTEPTATGTPDPSLTELLVNTGFETDVNGDKIPDGWTGSNTALAKTDKVKCNKDTNDDGIPDKIFARTGSCAFEFKGNVTAETSKIFFKPLDFSAITNGATVTLSVYIDPRSGTPAAKFAQANIKFSDGTKTKLLLNIPGGLLTYTLQTNSTVIDLTGRSVASVKVDLRYNGISGKFLVDDVSLTVGSAARSSGLSGMAP